MSARAPLALAAFALSAALTAIGTFSGGGEHEWREWLTVLAISAVATLLVFWAIVPRIHNLGRAAP